MFGRRMVEEDMVFPRSKEGQRRSFGLSLDPATVARLDVLMGYRPGMRSAAYRDLLMEGAKKLYGQDWERKADRLLTDGKEAA